MKTRSLLALSAALFLSGAAIAQVGSVKTPTTLNTEVNVNWPDNLLGLITPAIARQMLLDMIASMQVVNIPNNAPTSTVLIGRNIDFNSVGDTQFSLSFPPGITSYALVGFANARAYNCTAAITTAQVQIFSAAGGGGIAVTPAIVGTNVSQGPNTANSFQQFGAINGWFNLNPLFFRIVVPQGSPVNCTAAITVNYLP